MTPRELWERYQSLLFDEPALGVRLDLSRMGLGERDLAQREAAAGAAEEVETVFHILERLAANPDRGVVSRAGRTPFEAVYSLVSR